MLRRTALASLATSFAALANRPAQAQAYPSKPITLVVPFAAGGPTDLMARIVGERMAKELGQQFIIDNTTGAAGTIAVGKVARAAPDGYTIGIGHLGTHVANGSIYKTLSLQSGGRSRADRAAAVESHAGGDLEPGRGQDAERRGRVSEGEPGQGLGRHRRHGLGLASRRARLLCRHRRQVPARALSRHRPRHAGPDRQPDPDHGRPVVELAAAGARRQDQGLCRDRQGPVARRTRDSDRGRGRLPHGSRDLARAATPPTQQPNPQPPPFTQKQKTNTPWASRLKRTRL